MFIPYIYVSVVFECFPFVVLSLTAPLKLLLGQTINLKCYQSWPRLETFDLNPLSAVRHVVLVEMRQFGALFWPLRLICPCSYVRDPPGERTLDNFFFFSYCNLVFTLGGLVFSQPRGLPTDSLPTIEFTWRGDWHPPCNLGVLKDVSSASRRMLRGWVFCYCDDLDYHGQFWASIIYGQLVLDCW